MSKIECVEFNSIDELFDWLADNDPRLGWKTTEDEVHEVYSKRTVISLADYNKAVEKSALSIILSSDKELSHDAIQAMADMGHVIGYVLFGEAYLDSKTEKEEN